MTNEHDDGLHDAPTVVRAVVRMPDAVHPASDVMRIGRSEKNDIVLPDLRASDFHAEVRKVGNAYQIQDLGGAVGVHVNGRHVGKAQLVEGDRVSIGRHDLVFDGQKLHEYVDRGPASLFADDLTVQVGKATLLDDVSFAVQQGSLVGVIGPSGCGKSTLIKAVTGLRPANQGKVHYDGRDLYDEYSELRFRIGMVPQDDVLHRQLTVRRALRFAASLRFADDVPRKQRHARVDEVIHMLGLESRAKQRIDTLSGGQRKRTSVALELLTEPSLLCLDEPTSGLDPALDRDVMRELRRLADNGRPVLVVTHRVLHLDMCDRVLVMCLGGRMGFFGPPAEVLEFFGANDYADVFEMITNDAQGWGMRYRNSETYRKHVGEVVLQLTTSTAVPSQRTGAHGAAGATAVAAPPAPPAPVVPPPIVLGTDGSMTQAPPAPMPSAPARVALPVAAPPAGPSAPPGPPGGGQPPAGPVAAIRPKSGLRTGTRSFEAWFRQLVTLSARMVAVIVSDRGYALFLLGLPLMLALLTHSVPGCPSPNGKVSKGCGLGPDATFSLEGQRLLVVLIIGAAFMGIAIAIREIVNEQAIYGRERAVGIAPGAYLGSKLIVFLFIDVAQTALFTWLSLLGRGKPEAPLIFTHHSLIEVMIPVALVAFCSTLLGLLVSALVKTTEQTTPFLVISVMAQLIFSGGLFQVAGQRVLEIIAWFWPSRWGFAAAGATVDLLHKGPLVDPLWTHSASSWWRSIGWMGVQIVVLVGLARLALMRHEPGKKN